MPFRATKQCLAKELNAVGVGIRTVYQPKTLLKKSSVSLLGTKLVKKFRSPNISRLRVKAWFRMRLFGKKQLIALAVGLNLKMLTKQWTKISWKVFGGRLKLFTKKVKFMKVNVF